MIEPDRDADGVTATPAAGLLDGYVAVEVADLTGQLCGRILADLGMDVIKVEPLSGDPVRRASPQVNGTSLRFAHLNAGKQSVSLDLSEAEGQRLLHELVGRSDVLLTSQTDRSLAAWGLDHEALRDSHPRLIDVSVTGFGRDGPYSAHRHTDIVGMAMGGLMYVSGDPDLAPVRAPETQAYYFASVFAAQGALLALLRREVDSGRGASVDVSVQQALASIEQQIRIFGMEGKVLRRRGSQHKHVAPARVFPTKDGHVSLFVTDIHWDRFLGLWPDHPVELDAPELASTRARMERVELINGHVRAFVSSFSTRDFLELMSTQGVPCTPVNSLGDFLDDAQTEQRGLLAAVTHPELATVDQVGFPAVIDGRRPGARPAPRLGEHSRTVLAQHVGLPAARLDELEERGVIGA